MSNKFKFIHNLFKDSPILKEIGLKFEHIKKADSILAKILPSNLQSLCHTGNIDAHIIYIYTHDPNARYLLSQLNLTILSSLRAHVEFGGLKSIKFCLSDSKSPAKVEQPPANIIKLPSKKIATEMLAVSERSGNEELATALKSLAMQALALHTPLDT